MRTLIIGVLLGIIIGAGGLWLFQHRQSVTLENAGVQSMSDAKKLLNARLEALELQSDKIEKELKQTGRIIRRKAVVMGSQIADSAADAGITAAVKAKLAVDPDLSALAISVSTTRGIVTFSGSVGSSALVGKAVLLAYETDGVREVLSTLQVVSR